MAYSILTSMRFNKTMLKFKDLKRLVLQLEMPQIVIPSRDKQICRLTIDLVKAKHRGSQSSPGKF